MSRKVYKVSYAGVPLDHQVVFVETDADGTGHIFHVIGNIQEGMSYEHKPGMKPEDSVTFVIKEYIRTVSATNYARIESIVNDVDPPKKQFDGARRINPQEPLRRCQEWTTEAIQALRESDVLDP
jgi:hypothetical protein